MNQPTGRKRTLLPRSLQDDSDITADVMMTMMMGAIARGQLELGAAGKAWSSTSSGNQWKYIYINIEISSSEIKDHENSAD